MKAPTERSFPLVLAMAALIALLDGFDTQAIGLAAPSIAREWGVDIRSFGAIFAASLVGLMIGALLLGPAGDKYGRRLVLLWSFAMVGVATLAAGIAFSRDQLFALRFLTGLGLGGTVPNAIALVADRAPPQRRAIAVALMFAGFPLGAAVAGLVAAPLITNFGWQSLFLVGGGLSLAVCALVAMILPRTSRTIASAGSGEPGPAIGNSVWNGLFGQRAAGTFGLWAVFFLNLLVLYFLLNWLPAAMQESGASVGLASHAITLFNLGGVVAGLSLSWLADRRPPHRMLAITFLAGALAIAAIGRLLGAGEASLIAILVAGGCIAGGQFGLNALAVDLYPPAVRSTGIGWAVAVGRLGAIVGPLLGGLLLAAGWGAGRTLVVFAASSALCAAVIVWLSRSAAGRPRGRPDHGVEISKEVPPG